MIEDKVLVPDYLTQVKERLVTKDHKDEWYPILRYRREDGESVPLAAKTELVLIAGDKKARKSMMLSCIAASRFHNSDRKHTLGFELEMEQPILCFDTEQPMGRVVRNRKKYLNITGNGWAVEDPNFLQYSLRGFSPHTMVHQITGVIEEMVRDGNPPGVVMIDQIVDLIPGRDENDKLGASDIIDKMNEWVGVSGCLLMVSMHLNRGGEQSNGKVGVLMDMKADCGFRLNLVEKTWETELVHTLARENRMPSIVFGNDNYGLPLLLEEKAELNNKKYF